MFVSGQLAYFLLVKRETVLTVIRAKDWLLSVKRRQCSISKVTKSPPKGDDNVKF